MKNILITLILFSICLLMYGIERKLIFNNPIDFNTLNSNVYYEFMGTAFDCSYNSDPISLFKETDTYLYIKTYNPQNRYFSLYKFSKQTCKEIGRDSLLVEQRLMPVILLKGDRIVVKKINNYMVYDNDLNLIGQYNIPEKVKQLLTLDEEMFNYNFSDDMSKLFFTHNEKIKVYNFKDKSISDVILRNGELIGDFVISYGYIYDLKLNKDMEFNIFSKEGKSLFFNDGQFFSVYCYEKAPQHFDMDSESYTSIEVIDQGTFYWNLKEGKPKFINVPEINKDLSRKITSSYLGKNCFAYICEYYKENGDKEYLLKRISLKDFSLIGNPVLFKDFSPLIKGVLEDNSVILLDYDEDFSQMLKMQR